MWISLHISHAVDMYAKTNCRYGYHYGRRQCIKRLEPIHLYCVRSKPRSQRHNYRRTKNQYFIKNQVTKDYACKQSNNSHDAGPARTNPTTRQSCECTCLKRRKKRRENHLQALLVKNCLNQYKEEKKKCVKNKQYYR